MKPVTAETVDKQGGARPFPRTILWIEVRKIPTRMLNSYRPKLEFLVTDAAHQHYTADNIQPSDSTIMPARLHIDNEIPSRIHFRKFPRNPFPSHHHQAHPTNLLQIYTTHANNISPL